MNTYDDYLQMKESLTLEEADLIYREMLSSCTDEEEKELCKEAVAAAVRYNGFRTEWNQYDVKEKADKDSSRTSCHDKFIICLNRLSRYLAQAGIRSHWRDLLGDEKEPYKRKRIGDYAAYIALFEALNAR